MRWPRAQASDRDSSAPTTRAAAVPTPGSGRTERAGPSEPDRVRAGPSEPAGAGAGPGQGQGSGACSPADSAWDRHTRARSSSSRTIVSPTGKEKTGYPTQKPEGILRRIVAASSRPGDWVLDFFAGSGTTGAVAAKMERRFVLIDQNTQAIEVMHARLPEGTAFATLDGSPAPEPRTGG